MAFFSWFHFLLMYSDMEALDALLGLHSHHDKPSPISVTLIEQLPKDIKIAILCHRRGLPYSSSSMEKVPAEIKLAILREINDFHSLCALILAVPAFNDLYQVTRESVITAVTCNILLERGITILTRPCVWVEVCCKPGYRPLAPWRAIGFAYKQMKSAPAQHIRLKVKHCRALLTIKDSIQWWKGDELEDGFFEGHVSRGKFAFDHPYEMRRYYAYEYEPDTKLRFQSSMVDQHRLNELLARLRR